MKLSRVLVSDCFFSADLPIQNTAKRCPTVRSGPPSLDRGASTTLTWEGITCLSTYLHLCSAVQWVGYVYIRRTKKMYVNLRRKPLIRLGSAQHLRYPPVHLSSQPEATVASMQIRLRCLSLGNRHHYSGRAGCNPQPQGLRADG